MLKEGDEVILSPIQKEIVELSGNLMVRASAGTGKTHTMVSKIMYDIERNNTHKVVAAITFTIKAASKIKKRLTIDIDNHFIGTNNSFVIEEIIKPFLKDVFGKSYDLNMSTDYSVKVKDFMEGLTKIKDEQIISSYSKHKENFVFQLALYILKRSKACQLYLKSKYFKIYIDEYQDCDKDMHKLFMFICENLKIDTFVVGDEKQSIYIWRGANPEAFMSIFDRDDFVKKLMIDNFRSCQQIQNYSNLLCDETRYLYKPVDDLSSIIIICTKEENWVSHVIKQLNSDKNCALLRYSNADAEAGAKDLTCGNMEFTYIPQTPIAEITTDAAWLYNAIAKFFILPKYSVYDFRDEIPNEIIGNKKLISYIKRSLNLLNEYIMHADLVSFIKQIKSIGDYFGYDTKPEHCQKVYETICNEKFHYAFNFNELKRISITLHSSKGLEFEQVILFASDYKLIKESDVYNHYVAATRAKSKLILVYLVNDNNAYWFANNMKNILKKSNLTMRDIATVVEYMDD